jgi:hypothetical protein
MANVNLFISEDTVTPWADEKINSINSLKMELLTYLAEIFLDHISEAELVPHLSGTLEESAHDEEGWVFVNASEATGLLITWSGEDNPSEEEWASFQNSEHEDYALANYTGFHWRTLTKQPKHHWVVSGMFDVFLNSNGLDKAGKQYMEWLLSG